MPFLISMTEKAQYQWASLTANLRLRALRMQEMPV